MPPRAGQKLTVSPVKTHEVITTAADLKIATEVPFYFLPEVVNYPGLDGVV